MALVVERERVGMSGSSVSGDVEAGTGLLSMSVDEYAAYQTALGERIVKAGEVYWRRVRPLFYRPLLFFEPVKENRVRLPLLGSLGAVQYVVVDGDRANSAMKLIIREPASEYSIDCLDRSKKRQIRQAEKLFTVRPIGDLECFANKAYQVYLDFYERTHYAYKSDRRDAGRFRAWAQIVFRFPQFLVLGAWLGTELQAVAIAQRISHTIVYSTFFASTAAMRCHVASLVLHHVCRIAADVGAKRIVTGLVHQEIGLAEFYLQRGFKVVTKPAVIRGNPLALAVLRIFCPAKYALLRTGGQDIREQGP